MVKHNQANGDEIVYEREWVEELNKLTTRIGEEYFFVRYKSPALFLCATGSQLRADARTIRALLQPQLSEGLANALIEIYPPAEEFCQYTKLEDGRGGAYLAIAYPDCTQEYTRGLPFGTVTFEISTDSGFLGLTATQTLVQ